MRWSHCGSGIAPRRDGSPPFVGHFCRANRRIVRAAQPQEDPLSSTQSRITATGEWRRPTRASTFFSVPSASSVVFFPSFQAACLCLARTVTFPLPYPTDFCNAPPRQEGKHSQPKPATQTHSCHSLTAPPPPQPVLQHPTLYVAKLNPFPTSRRDDRQEHPRVAKKGVEMLQAIRQDDTAPLPLFHNLTISCRHSPSEKRPQLAPASEPHL